MGAVVDNALLLGHFMMYDELTTGPCEVSAGSVVHPATFAANALLSGGKEYGPFKGYIGTYEVGGNVHEIVSDETVDSFFRQDQVKEVLNVTESNHEELAFVEEGLLETVERNVTYDDDEEPA